MKSFYTFLILTILSVAGVSAQNITGKVLLSSGEVSLSGNLTLIRTVDSQSVKFAVVDENGLYEFNQITVGEYFIRAEEVGYPAVYSKAFSVSDSDILMPDMIIDAVATTEYQTVDIVYRKPIVELRPDMTVFNVDSTINSVGLDAFELLRRSPGVVIDKDENISLNGKSGLIVMIDGRITPMSGKELGDYLKSIPSNMIDKIELISNPSAKYDAAGNAGIINIRLKKNDNIGYHGSVNTGYSVGVYSRYDAGVNFNRRSSKTNIFGSYSFRTGNNWNNENFSRETTDSVFVSKNTGRSNGSSHNYKAGMDYFLGKNSTVGVMIQGVARDQEYHSTNMLESLNRDEEMMRYYQINMLNTGNRNNLNANLNYAYRNSESGTSLTWDMDFGHYDFGNMRLFPYQYYNKDGVNTHNVSQKYDMPVGIRMLTSKMDYERKLGKGQFSAGVKISNINTDNDQVTHWDNGSGWEYAPLESNEYNYTENIQAVYGQYQQSVTNFTYYLGLRAENTMTKGHSTGQIEKSGVLEDFDSVHTRNYIGFFPNAGITYNKNPMSQWSLNYSRRIDRPNYQDLNPFVFRVNDFIDRVGNGYLKPQISNKVSVGHTYKYMVNTRLEYTHTKDLFGEIIDTIGGRLAQTKENINSVDIISLNVSVPFRWKEFSMFTNVNAFYARYQSNFGADRDLSMDAFTVSLYGQASYNIRPWLTAEVSGWYVSPSVFMGTFRAIAMGGVDAGLQARVLENKGVLKLSVGDVFRTMKWGGGSDFVGQKVDAYGYWESHRLSLNFSYNFGNNKFKGKSRNTGNEDEKIRVEGESNQGMNSSK